MSRRKHIRFTPELVIIHKEAEKISLQSAVVGSPIPYHPGAIKYYQEKGLKIQG